MRKGEYTVEIRARDKEWEVLVVKKLSYILLRENSIPT